MSDEPVPGSEDARPGPGWGQAIPFVAVVVALVAIVGTLIDVHVLDGQPTTPISLAAPRHAPARPGLGPHERAEPELWVALGQVTVPLCTQLSARHPDSDRSETGVATTWVVLGSAYPLCHLSGGETTPRRARLS